MREIKIGERNPYWKDNEVKLGGLHQWIRKYLPKPDKCPICTTGLVLDLANITGIYDRNLINWQWQCRRCHMESDGRMKNLVQNSMTHEQRSESVRNGWITRKKNNSSN